MMKSPGIPSNPESLPPDSRFLGNDGRGCGNDGEGVLYVVATPIGNLGDLSERAAEVLRNVSLIAAEDTRVTRKLLTRIGAHPRVVSYHENSPATRLEEILAALDSGDVALVTDAGTPALSDPGSELVAAAAAAGRNVAAVPGPSAVAAGLSIAGMPADRFLYLGFLPRQRSRRVETLRNAASEPGPLVILEAPHRVTATLETIADLFPDRAVAVCRELTKRFEEVYRGDAAGALEYFAEPRGEFVVVVEGAGKTRQTLPDEQLTTAIEAARSRGLSGRTLVDAVVESTGASRSRVYRLTLKE